MVLRKRLQVRHVHLHELYILQSHKADVTLKTTLDRLEKLHVLRRSRKRAVRVPSCRLEVSHAERSAVDHERALLLVRRVALDAAVVQDQLEQIDDVDLHRMVLALDKTRERVHERLHDQVRYLVRDAVELIQSLQEQVKELARRSIH